MGGVHNNVSIDKYHLLALFFDRQYKLLARVWKPVTQADTAAERFFYVRYYLLALWFVLGGYFGEP